MQLEMIRSVRTALLVTALAGIGAACRPPLQLRSGGDSLARLGWLSGSWFSRTGGRTSEEHWTHAAGGTLLGVNRTVLAGRTVHREQLRLERRPGGIYYVASPLGQKTTAFRLVRLSGHTAVFENLAHDFPKRIIYRRQGRTLHVRIEGKPGGRTAQWKWRRARLPAD